MADDRTYREVARRENMVSFRVVVEETDLFVHAARPLERLSRELILRQREFVKGYIRQHPQFMTTLNPWPSEGPMPRIVRDMTTAAEKAGVGPMAAVAGAISERVGLGLLDHTGEVIVENGGDVFLKLDSPFTAGIFAGESPLSLRMGIEIDPKGVPMAVCTSSGTVGHSLSLGRADAVCIVSHSCPLADAAATSVGNRLKSAEDISAAIDFGRSIPDIQGIVVVMGDQVGMWGDLNVVPLHKKGLSF
jgi:ApbE superfamily uncharacterized protein (UPF0280 family)